MEFLEKYYPIELYCKLQNWGKYKILNYWKQLIGVPGRLSLLSIWLDFSLSHYFIVVRSRPMAGSTLNMETIGILSLHFSALSRLNALSLFLFFYK